MTIQCLSSVAWCALYSRWKYQLCGRSVLWIIVCNNNLKQHFPIAASGGDLHTSSSAEVLHPPRGCHPSPPISFHRFDINCFVDDIQRSNLLRAESSAIINNTVPTDRIFEQSRSAVYRQYEGHPDQAVHLRTPALLLLHPVIASTNTSSQGPQEMQVTTLPDPVPLPSQYLIAIHATATNFFDLLQIRGKYQHQPPLPWISGSEFSGVVLKVPSDGRSKAFKVGDRVFGAAQGGYATHVFAVETSLRPVPKGWGFFEAAGLFVTAPTSYAALVNRANVKPGDWVLVHAAAGGVGLAAVQIAKALGATVVATAGSARKLEVAKGFGADHLVDYRDPKWPELVKKLTPKGRGVDVVYDPVGLVAKSMSCTAWNGRIVVIGFAAGDIEKVATNRILLKNISVVGLHWGAYTINEPEAIDVVWKGLFDLMESGKFKGTCFTDKEYVGLESVPAALQALGARDTWGKVVVKVPQEGANKL